MKTIFDEIHHKSPTSRDAAFERDHKEIARTADSLSEAEELLIEQAWQINIECQALRDFEKLGEDHK